MRSREITAMLELLGNIEGYTSLEPAKVSLVSFNPPYM